MLTEKLPDGKRTRTLLKSRREIYLLFVMFFFIFFFFVCVIGNVYDIHDAKKFELHCKIGKKNDEEKKSFLRFVIKGIFAIKAIIFYALKNVLAYYYTCS